MKIIAINGSPKGKKSTTYLMVEQFLKGAKKKGALTEQYLLSTMKINPCKGCFTCWFKTPGKCVHNDDMRLIDLTDADLILYATPLYAANVSGLMKNFMDRSIHAVTPYVETNSEGQTIHIKERKKQMLMVMSNCGFPEQSNFDVLCLFFRKIAEYSQCPLIAEIYRGEGPFLLYSQKELLKEGGEKLKNNVLGYLSLLQKAGEEIVENLSLSEETKRELEKPFVPHDRYRELANQYFREQLSSEKKK